MAFGDVWGCYSLKEITHYIFSIGITFYLLHWMNIGSSLTFLLAF